MTRKEINELIQRFQGPWSCHIDRTAHNQVFDSLWAALGYDKSKCYVISYNYPENQRGVNPETLKGVSK